MCKQLIHDSLPFHLVRPPGGPVKPFVNIWKPFGFPFSLCFTCLYSHPLQFFPCRILLLSIPLCAFLFIPSSLMEKSVLLVQVSGMFYYVFVGRVMVVVGSLK